MKNSYLAKKIQVILYICCSNDFVESDFIISCIFQIYVNKYTFYL